MKSFNFILTILLSTLFLSFNNIEIEDVTNDYELKNKVIYFLSPTCKLCISKAYDINETIKKFGDEIDFVFVFHKGISKSDVKKYLNSFGKQKKKITSIFDVSNELAKVLNANITPSVFLLDTSGAVIYYGALDDKEMSVEFSPNKKSKSYIDEAINQYTKGEIIIQPYKVPVGCVFRQFQF
ncbi:MAG: redoxin family protein [Bacteroidetes bacterium]|nr:redoxin family protein [Bacteroidota bacterium]MBK7639596.1 redoxin family protein [Bacteroidota bacterium]MBL0080804.1 redoxin family protein [Bacteroidota bacterium]